jgi:hypothetical protein
VHFEQDLYSQNHTIFSEESLISPAFLLEIQIESVHNVLLLGKQFQPGW